MGRRLPLLLTLAGICVVIVIVIERRHATQTVARWPPVATSNAARCITQGGYGNYALTSEALVLGYLTLGQECADDAAYMQRFDGLLDAPPGSSLAAMLGSDADIRALPHGTAFSSR